MKDILKFVGVWGAFIAIWSCAVFASAEEITTFKINPVVQLQEEPVVILKDFTELPYDYAKDLSPELWYWWAKAYNARQWERTSSIVSSVLQVNKSVIGGTDAQSVGNNSGESTRRFRGGSEAVRYFRQENQNTQTFTQQTGKGPVQIYNPYSR